MAAMALMTDPELVIFDEPTTALDVTTQVEVLRAFREAVRERHATAVYVSHDLAVVAQIADRIIVLRDGTMREAGPTAADPVGARRRLYTGAFSPPPRRSCSTSPRARAHGQRAHRCWKSRGLTAGYGPMDRRGPAGDACSARRRSGNPRRLGARRHRRDPVPARARWRASSPACCRPPPARCSWTAWRWRRRWRRAAWKSCGASRSSSRRPTPRSTRRTASSAS